MDYPRKIEGTACRGAGSTMDTISQDLPNCKGRMTGSDRKGKNRAYPGKFQDMPYGLFQNDGRIVLGQGLPDEGGSLGAG